MVRSQASKTPTDKNKPASSIQDTSTVMIHEVVNQILNEDDILEKIVSQLANRIEKIVQDAVNSLMKPILDQVSELKTQVAKLQETVGTLNIDVQDRTDELEQYQRRNNLRVFGIPEENGENTDELVIKLFKDKLEVDVSEKCLDRTHRVGKRHPPGQDGTVRPRPIIVRFVSYRDRRIVFTNKKKLKATGVSIKEDLTSTRLELLRSAVEKFGRNRTWTLDGRIMWMDDEGKKCMATSFSDLRS